MSASTARIGAFAERHGPDLLRSARRYTWSPEDAEDVYQLTLEIALTKADHVSEDDLLPYLRTVAKHVAIKVQRERREMPPAHDGGIFAVEPLDTETAIAAREALELLAALPPNQRTALARQMAGLSYQEIQNEQGKTFTWVNRHLTEGRAALREAVGE